MKLFRQTPIAFAVCLLLFISCSDNDSVVQPPVETLNPDTPNANSRIVSEGTLGDPRHVSILRQLEADGSGGFYFCGILDSATVVGRLDGVGQPVWLSQTAYSVRDLEVVLPTSDHLLVVGGQDVDGDRLSDVGFVSLYSESGTRRDQLLYDSDSSQVWWNSFASLSDSTFLIVGGERTANMVTPFITTVTLRPNGTLEKGDHKALASLPGRFFDNAVTDGAGLVAGPDIVFYALSDNGGITPIPTISVHKVSAASGVTSAGIEWSQSIVTGPGLGTFAGPGEYLALLDQNLYITGWTDCLKNRVPTDIGYWRDGLVASVATDGTLRWVTEVEVTMHNEQFLGMSLAADGLYASGLAAGFYESGQAFGYGLISKIGVDDGMVLWNMTFGNRSYRSTFQDAVIEGGMAYCVGTTRCEEKEGSFVGWFTRMDVTTPTVRVETRDPRGNGSVVVDRSASYFLDNDL